MLMAPEGESTMVRKAREQVAKSRCQGIMAVTTKREKVKAMRVGL